MTEPSRVQSSGHYAVDYLGSPYLPAGSFDFNAHDRWVRAGHCPVVSLSKAWCSNRPHDRWSDHASPYVLPGGGQETRMWQQ
jgi:hypothetical protein